MDVNAILKRMDEAYATARTYSDHGAIVTRYLNTEEPHEHRQPFATWFQRPDRYRIELRDEDRKTGDLRVIWRNQEGVKTYKRGVVEETSSLEKAFIDIAFGPLFRGLRIPCMLLPEEFKRFQSLSSIERPSYGGEEQLEGVPCHKIIGRGLRDNEMTFWIDANNYLTQRVEERQHYGPTEVEREYEKLDAHLRAIPSIPAEFRPKRKARPSRPFDTVTTTTYDPVVGVDLDRSLFDFQPPKA